jgi:hypothetical protein
MANGHPLTFVHGARQRWALLPTAGFLVVVFLLLWLQPTIIWTGRVDETTRSSALFLSGVLALYVLLLVLRRWTGPFTVSLDRSGVTAKPLLGAARHVSYADIVGVNERPRTFFRHAPELELVVRDEPHVLISGDIKDYDKLLRTLRQHVRAPIAAGD